MEIFRDETGRAITHNSLCLLERERQVILDIHTTAAQTPG
jgi:hypothetical protein